MVQQLGHRPAPDFFYSFRSEKQFVADAIFNVESAAGDGDVNVWMLIKLVTTGVQGVEVTDLHVLFAGPVEHGAGGSAEESIKQRPVIVKKDQRRSSMVKLMYCQSPSGRICSCGAIHCSVALKPQALQASDLQL